MRLIPIDYSIRNLGRSPVRLILSVTGSLLVVLLVLAAGAFVHGMDKSLRISGQANNVMLLGAGSEESVERSEIKPNVAGLVQASVPGIRSRLGVAYVSPEVFLMSLLKLQKEDVKSHQLMLRGVTPAAFLVHSQARIVDGRAPEPGRDEMLVGSLVATKMGVRDARLAVGQTIVFDDRTWTIAGRFEAPGTVMEDGVLRIRPRTAEETAALQQARESAD